MLHRSEEVQHACNSLRLACVSQQHKLAPRELLFACLLNDIAPAGQPMLQLCRSDGQTIVALHCPGQARNDRYIMCLHTVLVMYAILDMQSFYLQVCLVVFTVVLMT